MKSTYKRTILLAFLAIALLALFFTLQKRDSFNWNRRVPLHLASIDAEVYFLEASSISLRGPGEIVALRLGKDFELVPYHQSDFPEDEPLSVEEWAEKLDSPVVFNAGQFDEKQRHLGWLKGNSKRLPSYYKKKWMGLLVSGPLVGPSFSGIIDLETVNPLIEKSYRHVVQSMMLLDEAGKVRVRETDNSACRTVLAQDESGALWVIITRGAVTLGDMARWVSAQSFGYVRAMNLDGGLEAQLAINTPELHLALYGQYGAGNKVLDKVLDARP
ncbi:phosphodiester glycosidase family protein, partial [Myxococcota bacterium]|nr:phosphodiester glycosidase family protein [Myxococcota bacterium]